MSYRRISSFSFMLRTARLSTSLQQPRYLQGIWVCPTQQQQQRRWFAKKLYKRCYGCLDMIHKSHYTKRMWQNKKDIMGRRCDQCLKKEKLEFQKRKRQMAEDTPSWMLRNPDWKDYF